MTKNMEYRVQHVTRREKENKTSQQTIEAAAGIILKRICIFQIHPHDLVHFEASLSKKLVKIHKNLFLMERNQCFDAIIP